jgi:predicted nucleic acid-binding protein
MGETQAYKLISLISQISITKTNKSVFALSPDPKDNYLFDLAIQNNCVFIITDVLELLRTPIKTVQIHTGNWFLKHFPV